jgi:hypothetical protein
VAGVVLVFFLAFSHVGQTEIELEVVIPELDFILQKDKDLADEMSLSALEVIGQVEVQLPTELGNSIILPQDNGETNLRIAAVGPQEHKGKINLTKLDLPGKRKLSLRYLRKMKEYELILHPIPEATPELPTEKHDNSTQEARPEPTPEATLKLEASISGPIQLDQANEPERRANVEKSKSVVVLPTSQIVKLILTFPEEAHADFHRMIAVEQLSLTKVPEPNGLILQPLTIISGDLFFEEVGEAKLALRPGEALFFDLEKEKGGVIRALELHNEAIVLKFQGMVNSLRAVTGSRSRNLMPTYLDTYRENKLGLFLVTVAAMLAWLLPLLKK